MGDGVVSVKEFLWVPLQQMRHEGSEKEPPPLPLQKASLRHWADLEVTDQELTHQPALPQVPIFFLS